MGNQAIWIAYATSNILGLLFLWVALKRPRLARLMFVLLFGWACWFNYTTAHQEPGVYMMYAEHTIPVYEQFINGWFREHITSFVSLIAIGQGLIAVGMLLKAWWVRLACIGAIIFLMSIAPLGIYAAFPFSLAMSVAAYFILRKDAKDYLWISSKRPDRFLKPVRSKRSRKARLQ